MISLIRNLVWNSREQQKLDLQKKFDEEQRFLDKQIENENNALKTTEPSSMLNIIKSEKNANADKSGVNEGTKETDCINRVGIVTRIETNFGVIDNSISFETTAAKGIFNDLSVGCRVEYLSYEPSGSDHIKLIKINRIVGEEWDTEPTTEKKLEMQIAELRKEQPIYFNTNQRNVIGLITERKPSSIIIDTDYKSLDVNLDDIEIDFVPHDGDRVYVCCNVQVDEEFVDQHGEILNVISVHPARIMKEERCKVSRLYDNWGVLNNDCYFTFDIMPKAYKLNLGDTVIADLVECDRGAYIWRCIKLSPTDMAIAPKSSLAAKTDDTSTNARKAHHIVTVSPDKCVIFSSTFERQEVTMTITNKTGRTLKINSIELLGRRRESQVNLIDPKQGASFDLAANSTRDILFAIESRLYGKSCDYFVIKFNSFMIKRSIKVIVCDNEKDAEIARSTQIERAPDLPEEIPDARITKQQLARHYAYQVSLKKREVVPGVNVCQKRRFVAHRIGFFEVPTRLRSVYLSNECKQTRTDELEQMYPSLKEDLCFTNYVQRFQTLLYLEEIENFIHFRRYDKERAHFTRENEFLSLHIENLAEQRPSLVIGDTVRAINPWSEQESDNRSYDGVIHKVLFERILLKFNPGFQAKYNGEDYRLEFYFSRFGFRKQHYATTRIVRVLGEKFLFPTKVDVRPQPQLDVQLDDNFNMQIKDSTTNCPWYNENLNEVQKRAVYNVLRGEAQNMPYVVFGPPGTGKTITLVECALQLVKHLPFARLLIGTPSNSSADLITTRIIESGVLQGGDFVRLVSLNQIEKDIIPDHLKPYCATVDVGIDGTCEDSMFVTESGLKLKCQMKYLGRHRVTIGTCTTLGNFLQMPFPNDHFTHVLIDESGQCSESEVMIVISQVSQSRGQVVLAGDPKQLQPISLNHFARDRGLSLSFLERTLNRSPYAKDMLRYPTTSGYDPRVVTKLLYNYRALPSILNVYNELFYDSELLPMVCANESREARLLQSLDKLLPESDERPKNHGAFFYGMVSENLQGTDSPSWYNPLEAKNVFLMTINLYREKIKPEAIGIITPYTKQVKHLRNLFIAADIAMPKIGAVEEFQGQERDIILVSTVRSSDKLIQSDLRHSLGFVQCPKRMNVAISRARYLLFIFGNPHLLAMDRHWRSLIKYCFVKEAYLGCNLPETITEETAPLMIE